MPDVIIKNRRFYNPVDYVLRQIGGTWKAPVLWRLRSGARRYSELAKGIPHISEKMLTRTLKELHADGILTRKVWSRMPPHTEYALTRKGRKAVRLIESIREAGLDWMKTEGIDYNRIVQDEKRHVRKT